MKMLIALIALLSVGLSIKPPTALCQTMPVTKLLPISLQETQRYDLEYLFNGYNLEFQASGPEFMTVSPTHTVHNKSFPHSLNLTNAKVLGNGRFLGIQTSNDMTILYVGMNDQESGVTIEKNITVENIVATKCFDVEEVYTHNSSYAIIDCANFRNNLLTSNEFYFVDLLTMQVREGTKTSDVFVRYSSLKNRYIKFDYDFINNVSHLYRVVKMDDVDHNHRNQTYIEVFEVSEGLNPYIIDVIDHTIFEQKTLSIADFKFYQGLIYILDFNRGLFELRFARDQKIHIRSRFNIKNDVTRFSLNRLGVNDDLTVVFSNSNHVFEYNWIIPNVPVLKYKYALISNSTVEHIFNNEHFVIVSAWSKIPGPQEDAVFRRIWVFSHRSNSYLDAFFAHELPRDGNLQMLFEPEKSTLVMLGSYMSLNLKFSLPFIIINPTKQSDVGKEIVLNITAISKQDTETQSKNCTQLITTVVILPSNMSVFGSGRQGRTDFIVDSPDDRSFYVDQYFYGPYLQYELNFNTTIKPTYEVEKKIRSIVKWNRTSAAQITFVDMFQFEDGTKSESIYGLVQDSDNVTSMIECTVHRDSSTLNCKTLMQRNLGRGPIKVISRVDGQDIEHRMAVTYMDEPDQVYVYQVVRNNIVFYGSILYTGVFDNQISSMSISRNLLFVTFEIGKRVDVYRLEDVADDIDRSPRPINRITSSVMKYFGVKYFAPMECETSIYHDEVVFLKTKTGVMALQVDEYGIPNLLFQITVNSAKYDIEIANDNILIIEETSASLYQLQIPLVKNKFPYLLQSFTNRSFTLGRYSDLIADQFFYIVNDYNITVIHTDMPSNSIFYDKIEANTVIIDIDAVKVGNRQFLIVVDLVGVSCWQLYMNPRIKVAWGQNQPDFEMSLTAKNEQSTSNVSQLKFKVLNLNESKIIPTEKFNDLNLNKILAFPDPKQNVKNPIKNISFSDQGWFNGSVLHYRAECDGCGKDIHFLNHVYDQGDVLTAPHIYDIESGVNGIYLQQYESVMKTHLNDSIAFQTMIPTNMVGEPCTKIAVPEHHLFSVSLCEVGEYSNMYMTSYVSEKPFTFGPTKTSAKHISKVQFVGRVLMIVDVDDNIFSRQGGIYLYTYNGVPSDDEQFTLLDVIQNEDLQVDGFKGLAYISSADMKDVGDHRYHLVLTEAMSGGIFVVAFHLTPNHLQVIYESITYINIHDLFDKTVLIPEPLRLSTVSIISQSGSQATKTYNVLVTVQNWHHIHLAFTIEGQKMVSSKIVRLFQRYPMSLVNYVKVKEPPFGFFAVPYINRTNDHQVVAIYDLKDQEVSQYPEQVYIPVTPMLGAHYVNDSMEVSFDFNETNRMNFTGQSMYDNLLFIDVDSHNLTSLKVNRNLTVIYENQPGNQTLKLRAMNIFDNFTFEMEITFEPVHPDPEPSVETVEIIWIIIMVVGFIVIIGLILICAYQIKKDRLDRIESQQDKMSLITRDSNPLGINRTTIDPNDTVRFSNRVSEVFTQTGIEEDTQNLP